MSAYAYVAMAKVSRKGWVVIPAVLRAQHRVQSEEIGIAVGGDGRVRIALAFEDPIEAAYGMLAGGPDYTRLVVEEHARERALEEAKVRA